MNSPRFQRPYQPQRDAICVASWALYALNRFVFVPRFGASWPFLRDHLGDSLLIPAALPLLLWARWKLGLRAQNKPPSWREIGFLTVVWALLFEAIGPRLLGHSVGDWLDALAYFGGGIVAGLWWNWRSPGSFDEKAVESI